MVNWNRIIVLYSLWIPLSSLLFFINPIGILAPLFFAGVPIFIWAIGMIIKSMIELWNEKPEENK